MKKPVLVGSRALKFWLPDFPLKATADWDFISEGENPLRVEGKPDLSLFSDLNNKKVCDLYSYETGLSFDVMELRGLALLKRSHLWRDLKFDSHITNYHKNLAQFAQWDNPDWVETLDERTKLTKAKYPQANPSLDKSNEDFFDDAVDKKFDHDWIHELVAFYERPLFESLKHSDGTDKAWCEKDLWEALPYGDKVRCVAEETHVISCERFMIPKDWDYPPKLAYMLSLRKVCTTLTSGWFRDFAIDNYPAVVDTFSLEKFEKVKENTT